MAWLVCILESPTSNTAGIKWREYVKEISTVEYDNEYTKHCEELTLVHELLHCAMPLFCNDDDSATMRDAWVELLEHQRIDMLAKSLIMAKYGVDIEWFMK